MSVEELRRWYQSLSDDALQAAYRHGSTGYTAQAWDVISVEVAARGLQRSTDRGSSTLQYALDVGTEDLQPLSDEEVTRLTWDLLENGVSAADIQRRLEEQGLSGEHVDRVVSTAVTAWRKSAEEAAGKEMLVGGLWLGGVLLVSLGTYTAAQHQGGSYLVTWGAMLYGAIRFFGGLDRFHDVGSQAAPSASADSGD